MTKNQKVEGILRAIENEQYPDERIIAFLSELITYGPEDGDIKRIIMALAKHRESILQKIADMTKRIGTAIMQCAEECASET